MSYIPVKISNSLLSGLSLTTAYSITHNLPFTPTSIILVPRTANASALNYISAITSTTFTVTFLTVPVLGVNNISFDWYGVPPNQ